MSDLSLFLCGFALVYSIGAAAWFYVCFRGWLRDRQNPYSSALDRTIGARLTLATPVWPVVLLLMVGSWVAERWQPSAAGRMIGDFVRDARGRSDDE